VIRTTVAQALTWACAWGPAAFGVAYLVAFGIAGIGRLTPFGDDVSWLWVAGHAWNAGLDPYDTQVFGALAAEMGVTNPNLAFGFAYPPLVYWPCRLLAVAPLDEARRVLLGVNLLLLVVVARALWRLAAPAAISPSLIGLIAVGTPAVAHTIWMGQTGLLAAAMLLAAAASLRRSPVAAGIACAFALVKPQLSVFAVIWILIEGRLRATAAAALSVAALMLVPAWSDGPFALLGGWLAAATSYREIPFMKLGFDNVFGLPSLLAGVPYVVEIFGVLAVLAAVASLATRRRRSDLANLALAIGIALTCLVTHDYDLVVAAPLLAWTAGEATGSPRRAAVWVLALLALYVPQRMLRGWAPQWALHWREVVVLGLVLWTALGSTRPKSVVGAGNATGRPAGV
jgi:hypothetical protein